MVFKGYIELNSYIILFIQSNYINTLTFSDRTKQRLIFVCYHYIIMKREIKTRLSTRNLFFLVMEELDGEYVFSDRHEPSLGSPAAMSTRYVGGGTETYSVSVYYLPSQRTVAVYHQVKPKIHEEKVFITLEIVGSKEDITKTEKLIDDKTREILKRKLNRKYFLDDWV